jgi:hypothetical protein
VIRFEVPSLPCARTDTQNLLHIPEVDCPHKPSICQILRYQT